MFVSNYSHSVDDKGRFVMPSKYRDQLDGRCMVTKGMDNHCLYIFTLDEWEDFAARLRALPNSKPEIRNLQRHFLAEAELAEIDKQGRCLISIQLREYAGISSGIKLLGLGNKIELWSSENWSEFENESTVDVADIAGSIDLII
ncbi:MAG: division/cell wall cluster transcriptional repressor MraZ [Clostridia bacterium]|nr:division/cell wall cluster transcriptional repressor MraZ [Clostridia bacterium]